MPAHIKINPDLLRRFFLARKVYYQATRQLKAVGKKRFDALPRVFEHLINQSNDKD
jgi:hypothetical protein